jgi:parallel beta-helix repeat protein
MNNTNKTNAPLRVAHLLLLAICGVSLAGCMGSSSNDSGTAPVTAPPTTTPDSTAPTVSISSPTANATVSGNVPVQSTASDNIGVAGVACTVDGASIGSEDTSTPYQVSWDSTQTVNGAHSVVCRARDAAGNATDSKAVSVTVNNTATAGTTYYVSPTGSDTGSCTSAAPCKTINRAAGLAGPGDKVSVAAGTYTTFTIDRSGTASSPITFQASGEAIIENSSGYGIYIDNSSYLVIDGFTVQNTKLKAIAARGATPTSPMRGLTIRNNTVRNSQEEGLYLSEVNSSLIENNTITDVGLARVETTGHGIYLANAGSDNTTIRGNTFQASPSGSIGAGIHMNGDSSVGGDGVITGLVIEGNWFLGGFNNALSMDGVQDSDVRNNVILDPGHHGLRAFKIDGAQGPKSLRVVNNTIRAPSGSAVKTSDDTGTSVIFNNILVGGGTDGPTAFGTTPNQGNNLTSFLADLTSYLPTGAAIGGGVTSLGGVNAPATDINGKDRTVPYDIGAVQH